MSESTDTQPRETRAERSARLAAERAAAESNGQAAPDFERLATLDPSAEMSDEDRAAFAALDEKQAAKVAAMRAEALAVAGIQGFATSETADLRTASTPVRNRKPVQQAMDGVVQQAYADWVAAGRPTTWQRMPVITYFVDPGTEDGHGSLADYRKWIRGGASVAIPEPFEKDGKTVEPSGVRVRFGKEFTLTEKMAAKIGHPENAGKTVLAWAAIDKRNTAGTNGTDTE
jgi:hypothetical protein